MNTVIIGLLKWALVILSIPFLVLFIIYTMRRMRALSDRIDEYHKEVEAQKQKPGPINIYQDMADVFGVKTESDEDKQEPGI